MRKEKLTIFAIIALSVTFVHGQKVKRTIYNFDFEENSIETGMPKKWKNSNSNDFIITTDTVIKHNGNASSLIYSINENTNYGGIIQTIPAFMKGRTITLKAYVKLENVENPIGLMLSIFGKEGNLYYENTINKGIQGTKDWTEYSITLPLPDEATIIYIGIIYFGKVKLWVDDVSLLVDNKDFTKAKLKDIKIYKADSDTVEFKENSKISISRVNEQQIENLDKLGRIWGMMKYYHPAISRGEYNWDYELFRIMPDVLMAKSSEECNTILLKWVRQFGPLPTNKKQKKTETVIKMKADLVWTDNEVSLGKELVLFLDSLEKTKTNNNHYYIEYDILELNPLFKNEDKYISFIYPDVGYRLLSLFKYWNAIQFYYPYKYLIGEDWNSILIEFIPKFVNIKSEIEYLINVLKLITRINDSHASINWQYMDSLLGIYYSPYVLSYIENNAIVIKYIDNDLVQYSKLQKGDIIIKVNDKTVNEIIKELKPITPASNERTLLRDIVGYNLLRSKDSILTVEFDRNGKIEKEEIKCYPLNKLYAGLTQVSTSYNLLTPDIGYINMESLRKDSIKFIMNDLNYTKGLIIDLRGYTMDYYAIYELANYLLPKPKEFVKYAIADKKPGEFYFIKSYTVGKKNKKYYKGKIVLLVNEMTQSRSEFNVMAFQVAPQAIIMGSPTAGVDGTISHLNLPSNIQTIFTGVGIYYPDGRETQRIGIIPDIEVKPTIQGIREGRDEVLEKAIEIINQK